MKPVDMTSCCGPGQHWRTYKGRDIRPTLYLIMGSLYHVVSVTNDMIIDTRSRSQYKSIPHAAVRSRLRLRRRRV